MFCHIDKKQPNFAKINMTNISGTFTQNYSRLLSTTCLISCKEKRSFSLYEFSFEMPGVGLLLAIKLDFSI